MTRKTVPQKSSKSNATVGDITAASKKSSEEHRTDDVVRLVQRELKKHADPDKAIEMAAYMRTEMPFYGVQKPDRVPILKTLKQDFKPQSVGEYEAIVLALWNLPYREEKYMALGYADTFISHANPMTVCLFEKLVREGAWWDFVDMLASHLVGRIYLKHRSELNPLMDKWIKDDDFWIRRTAILSQLKHKKETDSKRLFDYCLRCAHEKEFFIRKAIGWALREFSYTEPQAVKKFLLANKDRLSTLSKREGGKVLIKNGLLKVQQL